MNKQTHVTSSEMSISSKHYIHQLESIIIQIARSLSIEHSIPVDPDAKEMTREIVQTRINSLLKESTIKEIEDLKSMVLQILQTKNVSTLSQLATQTYHLLKVLALDDI